MKTTSTCKNVMELSAVGWISSHSVLLMLQLFDTVLGTPHIHLYTCNVHKLLFVIEGCSPFFSSIACHVQLGSRSREFLVCLL